MNRADQINPGAFRVMRDMWGVDDAVKAAKRMGVTIPDDMIQTQREIENEMHARWNAIFKKDDEG